MQYTFKNEHLDPSLHKPPRAPCVISVDQLSEGGAHRCISTHSFSALPSNPPSTPKSSQSPTPSPFISKRVKPETVVRVHCESLPAAQDLCRTAVLKHQAMRASCLENVIVYSKKGGAEAVDLRAAVDCKPAVVDLEFSQATAEAFVAHVRATFPPGIRVSVFKH